jgi:hypothetical protein
MEQIRVFIIAIIVIIIAILAFTLTKSWIVYDRGVQVEAFNPKDLPEKNSDISVTPIKQNSSDWSENAKVFWKNTLVYPIGLVTESGGLSPEGISHRAKNLILVNLRTGIKKKLFPNNVFIWDFFPADFQKKSGFTTGDEPKFDSIQLEGKMLIFAATVDTNADGFLSNKDRKKLFMYDMNTDKFSELLPEHVFYEQLIWNAGKNRLALVVVKETKDPENPNEYIVNSAPLLYINDFSANKTSLLEISEN